MNVTLSALEEEQRAIIRNVEGEKFIVRKMLGLGLRRGVEISVLQKRRQGFVLANKGTRIALSDSMAKYLTVSIK